MTARWFQDGPDGRVYLARTVEAEPAFRSPTYPLSRIVQSWDFERLPIPSDAPQIDAEFEGYLDIPPGSPRALRTVPEQSATATTELLAGDAPVEGTLSPGRHRVRLRWRADPVPSPSLAVEWHDGETWSRVPRSAWTPTTARPFRWLERAGLVLISLALGAFGFWIARARAGRERRIRLAWVAGALVLGLGFGLRVHDYEVTPDFRENGDELFATWNGWQLLTDGTTRGWSIWSQRYGDLVEIELLYYFSDRPFRIVRPYVEHPPLLHLLAGAASKLGGAKHWSHARLKHTRLVPLALGLLTVLLVGLLGLELRTAAERSRSEALGALLGMLLYAVIPAVVLQTRVVKEEALLTPLVLIATIAILRHQRSSRRRWLVIAALAAGTCPLVKAPGAVFIVGLGMLLLARRRPSPFFAFVGIALLPASLVPAYAWWVDWDLFWFTTQVQVEVRAAHWNIFPRFFVQPMINRNPAGSGWLVFLWLGWLVALARELARSPGLLERSRVVALVLPPVAYFVGIALSSGSWTYGWYLWPVLPFLSVGAGRFLAELWHRPAASSGLVFVLTLVLYTLGFHLPPSRGVLVAATFLLVFAPFAFASVRPGRLSRQMARVGLAVGLLIFVSGSAAVVYSYADHEALGWYTFDWASRVGPL